MNNDNNAPATKADEPVRGMTKNSKKVAAGKRLAEFNHKWKEELSQKSERSGEQT